MSNNIAKYKETGEVVTWIPLDGDMVKVIFHSYGETFMGTFTFLKLFELLES
jgi:hypothetical protein